MQLTPQQVKARRHRVRVKRASNMAADRHIKSMIVPVPQDPIERVRAEAREQCWQPLEGPCGDLIASRAVRR